MSRIKDIRKKKEQLELALFFHSSFQTTEKDNNNNYPDSA